MDIKDHRLEIISGGFFHTLSGKVWPFS
jgi:hypothetical protein